MKRLAVLASAVRAGADRFVDRDGDRAFVDRSEPVCWNQLAQEQTR